MAAITQLSELLKAMSPELQAGEFVFCTVAGHAADYQHLKPTCLFSGNRRSYTDPST